MKATRILTAIFVAAAVILATAPAATHAATVQFVYLSPADKPYRADYDAAIRKAVTGLKGWFAQQLGGRTFRSKVSWFRLPQTEAWYQTNPQSRPADARFWESVVGGAFGVTGGRFDDPDNRWIYYFDGDPLPGQYYGGTNGVALLPANDLRGLVGDPLKPINPGDPTVNPGFDRWVGGLGHEMGHALGLPHPPGSPGGADDRALLYLGYLDYPDTYLTQADKAALLASPFIAPVPAPAAGLALVSALGLLGAASRRRRRPGTAQVQVSGSSRRRTSPAR